MLNDVGRRNNYQALPAQGLTRDTVIIAIKAAQPAFRQIKTRLGTTVHLPALGLKTAREAFVFKFLSGFLIIFIISHILYFDRVGRPIPGQGVQRETQQ